MPRPSVPAPSSSASRRHGLKEVFVVTELFTCIALSVDRKTFYDTHTWFEADADPRLTAALEQTLVLLKRTLRRLDANHFELGL